MFLFWPWIALLAVCVLVIAILTIRFAGRVNLRPLDQRVKQDQVKPISEVVETFGHST